MYMKQGQEWKVEFKIQNSKVNISTSEGSEICGFMKHVTLRALKLSLQSLLRMPSSDL